MKGDDVVAARLRQIIDDVAVKRDFYEDHENNARIAGYMHKSFGESCDFTSFQGQHKNVVGSWSENWTDAILIGGHYDGPLNSPGADDNGSALAVLIALAEQLKEHKPKNVILVAFNGEEYGMIGSKDFASNHRVSKAVVLEMVGYYSSDPGSQTMPAGFPKIDCGDFLSIIGNHQSENVGKILIQQALKSALSLQLKEIKIPFGLENKLESLGNVTRSDHSSFWEKGIPAVMLTDTAEFRNKNYHQVSDTPDTLNYHAMAEVVRLLKDWVLSQRPIEQRIKDYPDPFYEYFGP
jgi:Zn-dependent M28 family amino/carboxypeptidase